MSSVSRKRFDVLVIGGGPAGMAAAASAAERGRDVGLIDENPNLGGQIWRGESASSESEAGKWITRVRESGVEIITGFRVFQQTGPNALRAEGLDDVCEFGYTKLVIATGARERFLPFPGWTLPNVMGAGGLQALVKSGLPIAGKRVVVAGTGPLLLAVAACLRKHGAGIPMVCEQASRRSLVRFGASLLGQRSKITQAFSLRKELSGIPYNTNSWPIAAEGAGCLERVVISRGRKTETVACDYLACGFHLVPNTELAALLGCDIRKGFVKVDDLQRTSVPGVFCAGEPTAIGGLDSALVEGKIAGQAAGGNNDAARELFRKREEARDFAGLLDRTFSLRSELRNLSDTHTIVCRCEDISYSRLAEHASWRAAKLQTRCGMGPCQGRVCGPATQFLFHWSPDSVRPPIFPARLENLSLVLESATQISELTGGRA